MAPHAPEKQPFTWKIYLISVTVGCLSVILTGLGIDLLLVRNGVPISIGIEALASAFFGYVFMVPCILVVWRIGLVTLGHYLLGVILLFLPTTLITLVTYPLFDIWIEPPEGMDAETVVFSAFVRLLRAAVLAPIAIFAFWASYHWWFQATPRRTES